MTVSSTKRELFDVNTVMQVPQPYPNRFLNLLDNRVGDFALRTIGVSALTLGITIGVLTAVFIGLSANPIGLAVALVGVGVVCFYVRSHFKKYHNTELLNGYKKEALEICKSCNYLDKANFIEGSEKDKTEIKKHALRPIAAIIAKHEKLENIFAYKILDVKSFKEAFDLEIKYLSFPEAIAFYKEVAKALKDPKALEFAELSQITPDKEFWKERFLEYIKEQNDLFDVAQPLDYDQIKKSTKVMDEMFATMEKLLEDDYFPFVDKNHFSKIKATYLLRKAEYLEAIKEGHSSILELEKIKAIFSKKYRSHSIHGIIAREQQDFLKGIREVQKNEEERLASLGEKYSLLLNPICMRNDFFEATVDVEDLPEKDRELYSHFFEKYKEEKAVIEKECESNMHDRMSASMLSDFTEMKQLLKDYKQKLDDKYAIIAEPLILKKDEFMRKHEDSMVDFRNEIAVFYQEFQGLIPAPVVERKKTKRQKATTAVS